MTVSRAGNVDFGSRRLATAQAAAAFRAVPVAPLTDGRPAICVLGVAATLVSLPAHRPRAKSRVIGPGKGEVAATFFPFADKEHRYSAVATADGSRLLFVAANRPPAVWIFTGAYPFAHFAPAPPAPVATAAFCRADAALRVAAYPTAGGVAVGGLANSEDPEFRLLPVEVSSGALFLGEGERQPRMFDVSACGRFVAAVAAGDDPALHVWTASLEPLAAVAIVDDEGKRSFPTSMCFAGEYVVLACPNAAAVYDVRGDRVSLIPLGSTPEFLAGMDGGFCFADRGMWTVHFQPFGGALQTFEFPKPSWLHRSAIDALRILPPGRLEARCESRVFVVDLATGEVLYDGSDIPVLLEARESS